MRLALLSGSLARDEPFKVHAVVLTPAVEEEAARHFRDALLDLRCALFRRAGNGRGLGQVQAGRLAEFSQSVAYVHVNDC